MPTRLAHHPQLLASLRHPTAEEPWRVLVSGCIAGLPCGVDGTDYGMGGSFAALLDLPTVCAHPFCPEHSGLGTPRTMPDLHGGDGHAVLDGKARVLDEHGMDLTAGMVAGAREMVAFAADNRVELALLTDASGACGTQVISDGCRFDTPRRFQQGVGVAAAALIRAGVPVVSQRDFATVGRLRALAEPGFTPQAGLLDHHQHPWTVEHFSLAGSD